jgi:hypothetical protein
MWSAKAVFLLLLLPLPLDAQRSSAPEYQAKANFLSIRD